MPASQGMDMGLRAGQDANLRFHPSVWIAPDLAPTRERASRATGFEPLTFGAGGPGAERHKSLHCRWLGPAKKCVVSAAVLTSFPSTRS